MAQIKNNENFRKFSHKISEAVGSPVSFALAVALILIWLATGPIFQYSDTWQLIINTSTTIVTFLMVFVIQNAQNRDSKAFHLKLDELIRGVKGARSELMGLEQLSDQELEKMQHEFKELHDKLSRRLNQRRLKKQKQ